MSSQSVVLVGIPASGKTTVGQALAPIMGLPFLDADEVVSERLGQTATEAFADAEGERAFRTEQEALIAALLASPAIVALGSAAVESAAVRAALVGHRVVWLRTSVVNVTRRLGMAKLGMETLIAIRTQLDAQLAQRARWYEAVATEVVDTDRMSVAEVAEHIVKAGQSR